ncbi:hypothetical protein [Roseovarius tolerans]|uniref:hypothetical protein n=1 Tax=Roseovarius tolerans TaxID=74031 RepID=UPI001113C959|nr:hypothetical protein [Roseovarius tolerans]
MEFAKLGQHMNILNTVGSLALLSTVLLAPNALYATDCSAWSQFNSTQDYLESRSIDPLEVDDALNASQFSRGLEITTELRDRELWIDILSFPGDAPVVTGTAAIMKVGRLAGGEFDALVLVDNGTPIFLVDEPIAREVGCQFIWGREGGENPIHLLRILMKNLKRYDTRQPVTTGFTGHLLGDTTLAMRINNEVLAQEWAFSALE